MINLGEPVYFLSEQIAYLVEVVSINLSEDEVTGNLTAEFMIKILEGKDKNKILIVCAMNTQDLIEFPLSNENSFRFNRFKFFKDGKGE